MAVTSSATLRLSGLPAGIWLAVGRDARRPCARQKDRCWVVDPIDGTAPTCAAIELGVSPCHRRRRPGRRRGPLCACARPALRGPVSRRRLPQRRGFQCASPSARARPGAPDRMLRKCLTTRLAGTLARRHLCPPEAQFHAGRMASRGVRRLGMPRWSSATSRLGSRPLQGPYCVSEGGWHRHHPQGETLAVSTGPFRSAQHHRGWQTAAFLC